MRAYKIIFLYLISIFFVIKRLQMFLLEPLLRLKFKWLKFRNPILLK